jgi:hypothetical protein
LANSDVASFPSQHDAFYHRVEMGSPDILRHFARDCVTMNIIDAFERSKSSLDEWRWELDDLPSGKHEAKRSSTFSMRRRNV